MKLKGEKVTPIDECSKSDVANKFFLAVQENEMDLIKENKHNLEGNISQKHISKEKNNWLDFVAKKRKSLTENFSKSKLKRHGLSNTNDCFYTLNQSICGLSPEINEENCNGKKKKFSSKSKQLLLYFAKMSESVNQLNDEDMDLKIVESLVKNGADINITDRYGQTIFHEVARIWHPDVAQFILSLKANINHADNFGRTPLHVASAVNYPEMVKFLIEHGAHKEALTFGEMQTPVHYAAKNDASESLKVLIKLGCHIEVLDSKCRTPLQVAAELGIYMKI